MDYLEFKIKNFKGIRQTSIDLRSSGKSRAISLIGLNESGKTTLLEAIHSFSPDPESQVLFSDSILLLEPKKDDLIPRGELSGFTGDISVEATISIDENDIESLKIYANDKLNLILNTSVMPKEFSILNRNVYENSKFKISQTTWNLPIRVKSRRQKNFRSPDRRTWLQLVGFIRGRLPNISYFPTFVFDFPDKIYLSGHTENRKNQFYKKIFQDILDYQGEGLNIDDHIVDRVRDDRFKVPWVDFFSLFTGSSDVSKIDQVMDKASNAVSELIFSRWNDIFKEKATRKEIIIEWKPEQASEDGDEGKAEGEVEEEKHKHNVFIKFRIKDGANRYDVSDRSLGFRWFFCFLLFTQFRIHRKDTRGTLFLFDEPASNLHAKAQEKLLESFPKICQTPNSLIYSTHSHNMIEPRWLEQAYIIENKAINYDESALSAASHENRDIDIKAIPYRQFVSKNPGKTSYFQPILDKLEVRPSAFDLRDDCVVVEGKSDYYIISYFAKRFENQEHHLIPGMGATTFDTVIALLLGWSVRFFILLDSDREGRSAKENYKDNYCLSDNQIGLLSEFSGGAKEIEDMLSQTELDAIKKHFSISRNPSKKQIRSFFQEILSTGDQFEVSKETEERFRYLLLKLGGVFNA